MSDQLKPGPAPHTPASSSFFTDKTFPGTTSATPASPPVSPPARSNGTRLIVAVSIFVVAIMGIAWVAQYLPNWRSKPAAVAPAPKINPAAKSGYLEFPQTRSVWDPNDDKYAREYERGQRGFHDYSFKNVADHAVELGVRATSCDCSKVEIAVFAASDQGWVKYQKERDEQKTGRMVNFPEASWLPWKKVPTDEHKGVEVPQGHIGLVRLSWEGKKADGEQLRLSLGLWAQPKGKQAARDYGVLETMVVIAPPIRFVHEEQGKVVPKDRVSLGTLAAKDVGRATFLCWSATRPKMAVVVDKERTKPGFEFSVEQLSPADAMAFETKMKDSGVNTRVQSAFRVHAKVLEPQLDQGPFNTNLPLVLDSEAMEAGPVMTGYVRGEVQIGLSDKVELGSFRVKDGTRQVAPLSAEGDVALTYDSHQPAYLEVKLEKNVQQSSPGQPRWNLEVRVPPGYAQPGSMPASSAVILRLTGPNPRLIRIPVVGNAIQG